MLTVTLLLTVCRDREVGVLPDTATGLVVGKGQQEKAKKGRETKALPIGGR